jgi:hypothetical protein
MLTKENQEIALERVKTKYPDAISDFTAPYKISATVYNCNDIGDADFWFGFEVGKIVEHLLMSQKAKGE